MKVNAQNSLQILVAMMTGAARFGVLVESAVLPDTRALLEQKGYLVKGAPVEDTAGVVIVGPLAHCVPNGVPLRLVTTMHEVLGITFVEMTSDQLHTGLMNQPDDKPATYHEEMRLVVEKVDELAKKFKAADAEEPDDDHDLRLHIGAELPNGKVMQAVICRNCALDFIEGRSEGRNYHRTDFLRTLMAFVISHADNERAERVINDKAIKASLEQKQRGEKLH